MGTVDSKLAADLRDRLTLRRAVETGTYRGLTARSLASLFNSVVTIELSPLHHQRAIATLRDLPQIEALCGHSVELLAAIAGLDIPTLYFLDGHWSAGSTEGADDQCPVIEEIAAIGAGHPDDCMIIDDARLFTSAPQPPLDPRQWPTITEVFDAIRSHRPEHVVTVLKDQVIAAPRRAKSVIDAYGVRVHDTRCARLQARAMGVRGVALSIRATMRNRVGGKRHLPSP
jgi:hypothetical protein